MNVENMLLRLTFPSLILSCIILQHVPIVVDCFSLQKNILGERLHPTASLSYSSRSSLYGTSTANEVQEGTTAPIRAPPRSGFAQKLLDIALESPVWKYLLVPQARSNIVRTAEANEIPWTTCKAWIEGNMVDKINKPQELVSEIPSYYQKPYHAYETGNLSWEAAYEVEIASCAVGARNFPQYGSKGEQAFRGAFDSALIHAAAKVPNYGQIVDLGSGTGMSTRRLAKNFPQAKTIVGIDLSTYFIEVGKRLLELAPSSFQEGGPWVSSIESDSRIEYLVGDAASALTLPEIHEESFDVVNLQFVLHELPPDVARNVVDESLRLLKPNGQLWICEMDFESPAYAAQRANPLLFSLIRSTEPYLDDYAESISYLFDYIQTKFHHLKVVPATGRHFALVATKGDSRFEGPGKMEDLRFDEKGDYRVEDTHLQVWESKQ